MSFGGPIDSMINSHRENMKKLHRRKAVKQQQMPKQKTALKFKGSNLEEMERWKKRIALNKRKDRFQSLLILMLSIIILLVILMWIVNANFSAVINVIE